MTSSAILVSVDQSSFATPTDQSSPIAASSTSEKDKDAPSSASTTSNKDEPTSTTSTFDKDASTSGTSNSDDGDKKTSSAPAKDHTTSLFSPSGSVPSTTSVTFTYATSHSSAPGTTEEIVLTDV